MNTIDQLLVSMRIKLTCSNSFYKEVFFLINQDKMAEEFFMNKNAKKLVDLGTALNDSKENIVHLVNIFFNLL